MTSGGIRAWVVLPSVMFVASTHFTWADDFDSFKAAFQQKATAALSADPVNTWDVLSLYVSRAALSDVTAVEVNKADLSLSAQFPQQPISLSPTQLTFPENNISCAPRCQSCGTCNFTHPGGCLCEALRGACIATEAPVLAACVESKAILDQFANAHLGSISFSNVAVSGSFSSPVNINIDPTFANITVNENLSGSAVVQGDANISLDRGTSAVLTVFAYSPCFLQKTIHVNPTPVTVTSSSPTVSMTPAPQGSDDGVEIQLSLQATSLDLKFNVDPLLSIIKDNPSLFVTCPLVAHVGIALGSLDQVFDFNKSISIGSQALPVIDIGQLAITQPGQTTKTKLILKNNALSIGVADASVQ
jgi:hypothetical protein